MALKKILMPKLGESVTEGTINSWLVHVGDFVNKYDPIAEVMTDKVNAEVPSSYSGTIKEIIASEGETVSVDELICYIETDDETEANENTDDSAPATDKTNNNSVQDRKQPEIENETERSKTSPRFSPAVAKLASEHNINLNAVEGSGLGGRITRKDIQKIIDLGEKPTGRKDFNQDIQTKQVPIMNEKGNEHDTIIPVTGIRKTIAQNMVRSKQEIPHAWMTVEVDVTDLVSYRNKVKNQFKVREGFSLTYFAFFVHAISRALKDFPELNSTWAENEIIQHADIHLSIAVAKEKELFVPVIKHADDKSIKGIAKAIHQLAEKTRSGSLTQEDLQGGTFTVNNTGTFGSVSSMGIINYPQAAILQVEAIVKRPVIINNMFAARDIVNLSLSLDHRILDGLICGQFLARVKNILENLNEQTIEL